MADVFTAVTQDDLEKVCKETSKILTDMKNVVNTHAEVLGLHRFILEKFVPLDLLEQGTKEYHALRTEQIDQEIKRLNAAQTPANA